KKGVGGEKGVGEKNTSSCTLNIILNLSNHNMDIVSSSKPSQIALTNANTKPSQIFALTNEASPIPTGNKNFNNSTHSIKAEQREIKAIFTNRIKNILSSERTLSKDKSSLLRNGSYYNLSKETQLSSVKSEIYDNESSDFNQPTYQINTNKTDLTSDQLLLYHLVKIRQVPNIVQLQSPKQKFGFGMEYAKKALDYAIRADKIDELVKQLENFIEKTKKELFNNQKNDSDNNIISDPIQVHHKGRQPKRYKSGGEIVSNKKLRTMKEITNSAYQELETSKSVIQDN
ncbi:15138_t:CDS:2, partial [Gigaspora margarita]